MADPFSDQDQSLGGAGKRPAHTIEGTATEISVEGDHPDVQASVGEDDPAPHAAKGGEADLPPPQASMPELKGFATHLAAGLLGGLVGVVALALAWGGPDGGSDGGTAPDISALAGRLAKLEAAPPSSNDADALAQLDARVETLENGVKDIAPKLSGLADRVAQLETALKALAQSASEGGSVASAAAIAQQIAAAEQRLDAKLADALAKAPAGDSSALQEMQSEIAALKGKIGALADADLGTGDGSELGAELASLIQRIAKIEAALPELTGAIGKQNAGAKSAAVAIAFANLRAAVSDGRPYAAELDTIGALAPTVGDLGILPAYAEKGIPTLPELAGAFAAAQGSASAIAAPAAGGTLVDNLMTSAQSLVKIKRIDEPATGEGAGAALARAKLALDKGDLASAVKEIETLEGAQRDAFAAWLGQAHARLSADETLSRLEGTLLVSMGADAQAPRP